MAKTSAAPGREILEAALTGLEAQREKLDEQILQVRSMLSGAMKAISKAGKKAKTAFSHAEGSHSNGAGSRKRVLSPEARKRIAAAQKKRWAAFRKTQG